MTETTKPNYLKDIVGHLQDHGLGQILDNPRNNRSLLFLPFVSDEDKLRAASLQELLHEIDPSTETAEDLMVIRTSKRALHKVLDSKIR